MLRRLLAPANQTLDHAEEVVHYGAHAALIVVVILVLLVLVLIYRDARRR